MSRHSRWHPAAFLSLALLLPRPAAAAWPTDPTVNVPLCTAATDQGVPLSVSDGAGGAIFVWTDRRNGNLDFYAQRVNASGTPLWTADGVALCTAALDQGSAAIATDGAGGAIVSWTDFSGGFDANDIRAQRVDAGGAVLWTAGGVPVCTATGSQIFSTIAADGAGGAFIAWTDNRGGTGSANSDLYVQRVDAAGAAQWAANGVALCTVAAEQNNASIVPDGAGGAIAAWIDVRNGNVDIYAQRLNSAGAAQWTANGTAVCVNAGNQFMSPIVSDGAGGALIPWQDAAGDIYAQRLAPAGSLLWAAAGAAVCTAANTQNVPAVAADGAGGAILTWRDARGANVDVYAQRMNAAGAPVWTTDGVALCTAAGDQSFSPRIIADGAGGAIVSWPDPRGGAQDIYAQRVDATGAVSWTADGVALCTAANNQGNQTLVADGLGGAVVCWVDFRNGAHFDIYAQRVLGNGQVGGSTGVPAASPVHLALLGTGLAAMVLLGGAVRREERRPSC